MPAVRLPHPVRKQASGPSSAVPCPLPLKQAGSSGLPVPTSPGEMVNLSVNQNAFDANAQVIRASDEMLGTLVDMIV